jgi:hypothetical protein
MRAEFPTVTDFEREFASLCYALISHDKIVENMLIEVWVALKVQ